MSETTASVSNSISQNSAPAQAPVETVPEWAKVKHKVKIDGADLDVPYDELVRGYQKGSAADKRLREAAQLKAQNEALFNDLKEGKLDSVLKHVPKDAFRKTAEKYLLDWIEEQSLSPDARQARELAAKNKEIEERYKQLEETFTAKQREETTAAAFKEIDDEITKVLAATGKKPTPRLIARIAEDMLAHLETRGGKLDAKTAYERTQKSVMDDIAEYLSDLPVERLAEVLPKGALDAIRKAEVDRAVSQSPYKAAKPEKITRIGKQDEKRMPSDNFFKKLDQKFGS